MLTPLAAGVVAAAGLYCGWLRRTLYRWRRAAPPCSNACRGQILYATHYLDYSRTPREERGLAHSGTRRHDHGPNSG